MKLAVFDFDGTLFPKDTLPFMLSQWYRHNYSKRKLINAYLALIPLFLKYKSGLNYSLTKEQMRIKAMKGFNEIFIGMTDREVIDYFAKTCEAIKVMLNQNVIDEIKKANASGYHTVILSGSYRLFLEIIGEYLQVDTVIGTEMYFDNGMFDYSKELDLVSGSCKVDKLCNHFKNYNIDWKESYAYADSYSDIGLLKLVGNPVAVNPDQKLKAIVLEKNWRQIA